jgi:hypothetical protein
MTIEFAELDIIGIFFEIIANDEQWGGYCEECECPEGCNRG